MASHVVVTDTSFRRQNIKVTPGTYMTDVLEEACKKFGLKSSNYVLKNKGKSIPMEVPFRQAGIVPGAKLELVVASKSPTVISVALQLPEEYAASVPGGRLTDKFSSDTTIWHVLRKFESVESKNFNFTARGNTNVQNGNVLEALIFYEMPVVNLMGRDYAEFTDLQKTLAQFGFNKGSCLIRLNFKGTDKPLEEAMAIIEEYFKEDPVEPAASVSAAAPVEDFNSPVDSAKTTSEEATPNTETETSQTEPEPTASLPTPESEQELVGPDQRPITIYSAPTGDVPKAALQPFREEDYEPSIIHAKLHQDRLKSSTHNQRLLSYDEVERLEKEKAAKITSTKTVKIKIKFPDQSTIISPFEAHETGLDLHKYVTGVIRVENQPFKLGWIDATGKRHVVPKDGKKLIQDLRFEGNVMVNFTWGEGVSDAATKAPTLKPQFAQKAKEIPIPEIVSATQCETAGASSSGVGQADPKPKAKGKGGVPSWLKLGKK
ncbi:hypothetical protein HYALB_00008405 [Hymenoscyphus albidus]|uniref:TUG ubiquitin-like domain-containing protein n=1 Tax=Hymenoscyphus albidus TaxID=595503 RepID=A0A9N9Q6K6_9HELO|nr:hypothetical protein HYALB_00008405 [Hymenoscyphus albidus]